MTPMIRWIACGLAALTLAACQAPAGGRTGQASTPMTLQIYEVPPARSQALSRSLREALDNKARVSVATPDKLLVYAPADAQASIGSAIDSLGKTDRLGKTASTEASQTSMRVRFWVVDAWSGSGSDDPSLKELTPALAPLRQSMGPLRFELGVNASAVTAIGQNGRIATNGNGDYRQEFDFSSQPMQGAGARVWVGYRDDGSRGLASLDTQIDLPFGQYVVLAQGPGACAPAPAGRPAPPCAEKPALRLLVVRLDRITPAA